MTLTESFMYLGALVGSLLALYYKLEWGGIALTFGLAFAGAILGAGIKAAVFMRRSGMRLKINIRIKEQDEEKGRKS